MNNRINATKMSPLKRIFHTCINSPTTPRQNVFEMNLPLPTRQKPAQTHIIKCDLINLLGIGRHKY